MEVIGRSDGNDADIPPFAEEITRELLGLSKGSIDEVTTWLDVANRLDCIIFPICNSMVLGELIVREGHRPVLIYSANVEMEMQCRIVVHEITHWMLKGGWPISLFPPEDIGSKFTDHAVARTVEELIFGDSQYAFVK